MTTMAKDLAQRVRQTAVNHANGDTEKPTLRTMIERMRPEIARALPKHMDPDRVARIAITLVGGNQKLAACTPESFLGALMTASQLGLEPGPLGEAYLVPYGRTCTFIPGYRGLIKLAWNSGQMKHIDAQVVRDNDEFDYAYGLEPYLVHKPARRDRGEPTEVYAVSTFLNGGSAFVVMSIEDVERIRKRSKAANDGPWVTDWDAMAKKTAIRQLARFLPLSTELRGFAQAVALDGSVRTDITGSVDDQIPDWIQGDVDETTPVAPERAAEPREAGTTDAGVFHDRGHTQPGSSDRRDAWHPDCSICQNDDAREAGANHYYGHTQPDTDCLYCQREQAWAASEQDGAGT